MKSKAIFKTKYSKNGNRFEGISTRMGNGSTDGTLCESYIVMMDDGLRLVHGYSMCQFLFIIYWNDLQAWGDPASSFVSVGFQEAVAVQTDRRQARHPPKKRRCQLWAVPIQIWIGPTPLIC